jgi:hypothetical protein
MFYHKIIEIKERKKEKQEFLALKDKEWRCKRPGYS